MTTQRLNPSQIARLARFGAVECVDVHCHVLPGLDDGPATIGDALELCRMLVEDGVTAVVATPHQLGRYDRANFAYTIREAVAALQARLDEEHVPLKVTPGADVRMDERITTMLDADEIVTLADRRRHLLLELPHDTYIDPLPLIGLLGSRGISSVISHPERHEHVSRHPRLVVPWLAAGAMLQVTAGSLLGDFGSRAEQSAWDLLSGGQVRIVATDAHDTRRRPPRFSPAIDAIERRLGREVARQVCIDGPARVLRPAQRATTPEMKTTAGAATGSTGIAGETAGALWGRRARHVKRTMSSSN